MTKFIDVSRVQAEEEKKKKTVFTHYLDVADGWIGALLSPSNYEEVMYLGKCKISGDMFVAKNSSGAINIYKGIKGDEF